MHKLNACHAGVRMDSGEGYGRVASELRCGKYWWTQGFNVP